MLVLAGAVFLVQACSASGDTGRLQQQYLRVRVVRVRAAKDKRRVLHSKLPRK